MNQLPTGTVTVTFLFTDIEGSTRLWQEQLESMRLALARHDEIVRFAIEGAVPGSTDEPDRHAHRVESYIPFLCFDAPPAPAGS